MLLSVEYISVCYINLLIVPYIFFLEKVHRIQTICLKMESSSQKWWLRITDDIISTWKRIPVEGFSEYVYLSVGLSWNYPTINCVKCQYYNFLKVSQTIARGGPRSQIAIPAQGMIEFRDALTDLLEEFGTDDGGFKGIFLTPEKKNWSLAFGARDSSKVVDVRDLITFFFIGELPEGRHLRVENKNFYFDIGQNNRGIYMRISEVNCTVLVC